MENIFLHKKVSIYKVYLTKSMNRAHLFPECKHMMKSGAPPDKVRVLYRLLRIDFHVFTSRINFEGLSLFGSLSYLNFLETVWVLLKELRMLLQD